MGADGTEVTTTYGTARCSVQEPRPSDGYCLESAWRDYRISSRQADCLVEHPHPGLGLGHGLVGYDTLAVIFYDDGSNHSCENDRRSRHFRFEYPSRSLGRHTLRPIAMSE